MQKITKPKKIERSKCLSFSYRNLINLTVTNKPIIDPDRKIKIRQKFKSLTAINIVVYVPSKRRIKLPDIPGIINAVTAMNPEKNKYKRFTSTHSLEGKRYRKLNAELCMEWPNIVEQKDPLPDSEQWKKVKDKFDMIER